MIVQVYFKDSIYIDGDTRIEITDLIPELQEHFESDEEGAYFWNQTENTFKIDETIIDELNNIYYIKSAVIEDKTLVIDYQYD